MTDPTLATPLRLRVGGMERTALQQALAEVPALAERADSVEITVDA